MLLKWSNVLNNLANTIKFTKSAFIWIDLSIPLQKISKGLFFSYFNDKKRLRQRYSHFPSIKQP